MEKKILIGLLVVGIVFMNFSFINATNYPAPFVSGTPTEKPTCDYGESYYDNSQGKWLCPPAKGTGGSGGSQDMYENLPLGTCIEQTCPGGDQTKCYCSRYSQGNGQVQAGNIQPTLSGTMPSAGITTVTGGANIQLKKTLTKFSLKDKVIQENTTKELSANKANLSIQNETDLIQPLLQKISELEERIKFLEEQLNKIQIQENKTNSPITGNAISDFGNTPNFSFWNKLKNLFRRNE